MKKELLIIMAINKDTLDAIISGLNSMPRKSEIDTPTNNIDLLATNTTDGLMSSSDKSKLDGIAVGANKYVHPETSGNKHIPSGGSDGQILKWKSNGTAKWATETKYGIATETSGGLMSSTDKTNLDEAVKKLKTIDDNANYYRLPTASNTTKGGVTTTSTVTSTSGLIACPIINGVPYYHDTTVSYDLPTASNTTKGGVITTSTVTSTSGLTACPIIAGVPYYNDGSTYALRSLYSDTTINIGRKSGTTVGAYSVAEGSGTTASGNYSHAEGLGTIASKTAESASGKYNLSNSDTLYSVGDGTSNEARHNAFEITTNGGKLHDKDIVTTDLIPTSLPANGGNADTLDGLHAEKFMRYEPDKSIVTSINDMITPGTYGVYSVTPDFPTVYGSWGLLEVQVYGSVCYQIIRFETNVIISRAKIVNQTEWSNWKRLCDNGNADTVDNMHASDFMPINGDVIKDGLIRMNGTSGIRVRHIDGNDTEFDGALYLNHGSPNAPIYMNGTNTAIHSGNIGSQSVNYATNAGNATNSDTVDGIHVSCTNDAGSGTNWLAAFVTSNDIHAIDPARSYVGNAGTANMVRSLLIGTSANCAYNTILAWANSQTGTAYASVVDGDGYPSDGPYRNEAMLKVESDYYGARKIVTWTRYLTAEPRLVMIRVIFNESWHDDQWRT